MGQFFTDIWDSIATFFQDIGKDADKILIGLIKIIAIIIVAKILIIVLRRVIKRMLKQSKAKKPQSVMARKAETIQSVSHSVTKYVVYFFALMAILGELGLGTTVSSLLATAGIGGIAVAFGAQDFVKDIVSGFFLLFENQFSVGEYIEVGDEKGTVEAITIRTTKINRFSGETTTIPNGSIKQVTNYSRGDHLAIIDMSVSYESDIEKASIIMRDEGLAYKETHDNILEEPHVLGVINFGESDVVIRMIIRVKPLTHWETERALRRAVKEAFDKQGVQIPYPHRVIING